MNHERELLEVGDTLVGVWGPYSEGGAQVGGKIGWDKIESITVDRLAGPMGYYLVAIIKRPNDAPIVVIPLHMAEYFEIETMKATRT